MVRVILVSVNEHLLYFTAVASYFKLKKIIYSNNSIIFQYNACHENIRAVVLQVQLE